MMWMRTLAGAGLATASLMLTSPALSADTPPWSEHAIREPVDQATLVGRLSKADLEALIEKGREFFEARFTTLDGAGRPHATQAIIPTAHRRPVEHDFQRLAGPDANACASCHNEPESLAGVREPGWTGVSGPQLAAAQPRSLEPTDL